MLFSDFKFIQIKSTFILASNQDFANCRRGAAIKKLGSPISTPIFFKTIERFCTTLELVIKGSTTKAKIFLFDVLKPLNAHLKIHTIQTVIDLASTPKVEIFYE